MVDNIIVDNSDTLIATGVRVSRAGLIKEVHARKEVILCAGVFQSPQILELSGIGSAALLNELGLQVLVDNPNIGENLQDHPLTGILIEVEEGVPTGDLARDPKVLEHAIEAYEKHGTGPLASTVHSIACMPVVDFLTPKGMRELDALLDSHKSICTNAASSSTESIIRTVLRTPDEGSGIIGMGGRQMHFNARYQRDIYGVSAPENYISFLVALTNLFSRRSVHISTTSIHDAPIIDPHYLSHPMDLELLARHLRFVANTLRHAQPLASLFKSVGHGAVLPRGADFSSLEAAKEHCRRNLITNNHPACTCSMLPRERGGVVDERLRVYGVKGLRIVDASVFPMIPKGNIQTTVYAVAERAADLIKEDYNVMVEALSC